MLGAGQAMVAFANTMSSWVSLHDLHCNSDALYVNICRTQGFFLVAGSHLLITSYACYMHMPPNGRISAGFSSLRSPRGAYGATIPPPRFDSAVATGTDRMHLRWPVWCSAHTQVDPCAVLHDSCRLHHLLLRVPRHDLCGARRPQ